MNTVAPMIVYNGTYTVKNRVTGEHRTFRLSTVLDPDSPIKGKRILALLDGPDNTFNYLGFAFVDEEGGVHVWRRYQGNGKPSAFDAYAALFHDLAANDGAVYGERYEILCARSCVRCNRLLTTPESIEAGIGPICASATA